MKRVTIYDVAKDAGVSLATVSRVVNGSEVVKGPTKERVQASIEKLGYKPNAIAQGLALQKTTTIALVVPEASFIYTGQIINGVIAVASMYNYNIMLHTTTSGITSVKDIIERIIKSHADGVVIYNDKILESEMEELNKYNIPIVMVGTRMSGSNISSVFVDYKAVVYGICEDYLKQNKKRIVILEDRKNSEASQQMELGAKKAFKEMNLPFEGLLKIPEEFRTSYAFLSQYLKDHPMDLLIANRDSQAMAFCNAARENGIEVPKDTEVICIHDTKYNCMVRPQITAFSIPSYDMGMVSMRVMTKMLNGETVDEKEIELSCLYTVRESTQHS